MMTRERFSKLVDRLHNDGARGWEVHARASEAIRSGEEGVVVLSIGDPDFATPEPIVDSAVGALVGGDTHYTPMNGRHGLRAAIAADVAERTGLSFDADNVVVTAGTQNALFAASLCVAGPGDEVIALEPMYLTYESSLTVAGATLVRVPQPAPTFRPDVNAIAAAITPDTRAITITNPNNPTGVVMNGSELAAIAELAIAHDLWVLSDEVYSDITFGSDSGSDGLAGPAPSAPSIASLPGMAERTVVLSSLSKSHAMTGWRIGWAVGPKDLIDHIHALQVIINYGVPGFVQEAALKALVSFKDTAEDMRSTYERRRNLVTSELAGVEGLNVLVPEAGMYVLVDVSPFAESSYAFCSDLFDEKRVSLLDAAAFGESADGWVRLSFTTSDEDLVEGCRRLAEFVAERA